MFNERGCSLLTFGHNKKKSIKGTHWIQIPSLTQKRGGKMLCAKRLEIQRAETNFNRCSHPPFICEKMCKKEANRPRGLIFRLKVHKFIWFLSRAFNSVLSHFYYGFPQVKVKMATKEAEGIKGAKSYFHLEIATRRRVEGQEKKLDFQTLQSLVWRMIKKKVMVSTYKICPFSQRAYSFLAGSHFPVNGWQAR